MPMLTFANQITSSYREETVNGVDYLIVPGIPIKEQVLKYYFVNADEIGKCTSSWNGIPLVINHPKENYYGSANVPNPDVPVIGTFYNAKMDGKKLTGEFWFDLQKLRAAPGGSVIEKAVRNSRMLEVSTGYFADELAAEGEYSGVAYTAIHQNLHPDHIAILPEAIGACSIEDGCGLPRLNCSQNCATCASRKENDMPDLLDQIKALLAGGAQQAQAPQAAQNANAQPAQETSPADVPATTPNSDQVQANAAPSIMLNADEYAYVRAYISLSADLGGTDNIKKLLLLMQEAQDAQAAQQAQDAADRADALSAALPAGDTTDMAMQNQAASVAQQPVEPVNYAGAVAPTIQTNAAAPGLSLPVAIPFK